MRKDRVRGKGEGSWIQEARRYLRKEESVLCFFFLMAVFSLDSESVETWRKLLLSPFLSTNYQMCMWDRVHTKGSESTEAAGFFPCRWRGRTGADILPHPFTPPSSRFPGITNDSCLLPQLILSSLPDNSFCILSDDGLLQETKWDLPIQKLDE